MDFHIITMYQIQIKIIYFNGRIIIYPKLALTTYKCGITVLLELKDLFIGQEYIFTPIQLMKLFKIVLFCDITDE